MTTNTIHLTTNDTFQFQIQPGHFQVIIEAFIQSCKTLDVSIFEPFMEENNVFEDKNKYLFLASLKSLFESYKTKKYLCCDVFVHDGICTGCEKGKNLKIFSVILSGKVIFKDQFAFIIEKKDEILMDIYRCRLFCQDA